MLSQQSEIEGYESISPKAIHDVAHRIRTLAFAEASATRMAERFPGTYAAAIDTGLFADTVDTNATNTTICARLEVGDQILYLRGLVVNGSSAL
jgi:hypothetical protein